MQRRIRRRAQILGGRRPLPPLPRKLNTRQWAQVSNLINRRSETRRFNFFLDSTVSTTAVFTDISLITLGDNPVDRSGNEIQVQSLIANYEIGSIDATNIVRVMILQYKSDSSLAVPTQAIVFEDVSNVLPLSPYNFDNIGGVFKVLYDRIHYVNTTSNLTEGGKIFIPYRKGGKLSKKISFNDSATSGTGKLYLCTWSDSGSATHPTVKIYGLLKFKDGA